MRARYPTLCLMLLLIATVMPVAAQNLISDTPSINVSGVGEVLVSANEATISASVITVSDSADESLMANSQQMLSVFDALNSVGIGEDQISTSQFSLSPRYERTNGVRVFVGYEVNNSILVTTDNIESVGPLLDLIISAGATQINSVGFGTEDVESFRQEAIRLASVDAINKAELIASQNGIELGEAIKITLSTRTGSITPPNLVGVDFSPAPPISGGGRGISATVHMTYAIASTGTKPSIHD